MAKPIYRTKRVQHTIDGVTNVEYIKVRLKPSEIKNIIMKANNWTEDQYRKQYDLFKNKLRAYESYKGAQLGKTKQEVDATRQSPLEVLYKQAKAMQREGSEYKPSLEMQRIQSFSAESITKGWKKAQDLESAYSRKRGETFAATTSEAFKNFIKDTPKAQEIMQKVTNPVKREEALKDLAEHVHAKQKSSGEVISGEAVGSDNAAEDYNIDKWLD